MVLVKLFTCVLSFHPYKTPSEKDQAGTISISLIEEKSYLRKINEVKRGKRTALQFFLLSRVALKKVIL